MGRGTTDLRQAAYARRRRGSALSVLYSADVERAARFWQKLGFDRHFQLPYDGVPSYVGLRSGAVELGVTHVSWATDRYGISMGDGPRVEMYVYVADLEATVDQREWIRLGRGGPGLRGFGLVQRSATIRSTANWRLQQ